MAFVFIVWKKENSNQIKTFGSWIFNSVEQAKWDLPRADKITLTSSDLRSDPDSEYNFCIRVQFTHTGKLCVGKSEIVLE